MYRTHRLARLLAPLALVGSIATATPLAQAASSHRDPMPPAAGHAVNGPPTHLRAYGGAAVLRGTAQHVPSPAFSVTICVNNHCVTISF